MARRFSKITFTPSVKAAQARYGSRTANEGFERAPETGDPIGPNEAAFIEARDGFYQATVSENGWPYVQFRGGPAGFLKVLDGTTIGYADFRGNVQYLSVGNLNANARIALILMDHAHKRRLKIWARARIVHEDEDPQLLSRLSISTYRARVERAVVLSVEAVDWNCPQHITPRFTETEIAAFTAPLKNRIAELERQVSGSSATSEGVTKVRGQGVLDLRISAIRQLTPRVRSYQLQHPDGADLPVAGAGAHLDVPVPGSSQTRTYSLAHNPQQRDLYEIAVLCDPDGSGGAAAIHNAYALGDRLKVSPPRNTFSLHTDRRPALLIAGGIGITALKPMAEALLAEERLFQLHYAASSDGNMAYRADLARLPTPTRHFYASDRGERMEIRSLLDSLGKDTVVYVCGPARMIHAVRTMAAEAGIEKGRVRYEHFTTTPLQAGPPFQARLKRSRKTLSVAADETLLEVLLRNDINVDYGCKSGTCGRCATRVLAGSPVHRDQVLSPTQHQQAALMCVCVSRTNGDDLVLDL